MSDAALMRETLERGLSQLWGRKVEVRGLSRTPLSSSSSFLTERLSVRLGDGRRLRVFFKDLNPENQTVKARAVRPLDLEPSWRELEMYRKVLSPERFGTLYLYAFRWEPELGRHWIFLEDGGRVVLHNTLDLPRWTAAARWLAGFHADTRDLPDAVTAFLPTFDQAHYLRCAERVEEIVPKLEGRERDLVSRGVEQYREQIERLVALPRCIIHGQYFGKNIMLRGRGAVPRICVIDWETAAVGPRAFDLVSLTSGKWTTGQRQAMRAAYVERYEAETGQGLDPAAFSEELDSVALYQALEWLAWWGHQRALSRHFANFLRELDRLLSAPAGSP